MSVRETLRGEIACVDGLIARAERITDTVRAVIR
ncbi:hypothetical protein FHR81_004553 [Actinoalloteichus hoggarensis]|nr:hypothetical protein [Actinoalloteichus hoggarensis]